MSILLILVKLVISDSDRPGETDKTGYLGKNWDSVESSNADEIGQKLANLVEMVRL